MRTKDSRAFCLIEGPDVGAVQGMELIALPEIIEAFIFWQPDNGRSKNKTFSFWCGRLRTGSSIATKENKPNEISGQISIGS